MYKENFEFLIFLNVTYFQPTHRTWTYREKSFIAHGLNMSELEFEGVSLLTNGFSSSVLLRYENFIFQTLLEQVECMNMKDETLTSSFQVMQQEYAGLQSKNKVWHWLALVLIVATGYGPQDDQMSDYNHGPWVSQCCFFIDFEITHLGPSASLFFLWPYVCLFTA